MCYPMEIITSAAPEGMYTKMDQVRKHNRDRKIGVLFLILSMVMLSALILIGTTIGAELKPQAQIDLLQPDTPEPQSFCGFCHILTYPSVFQKSYDTWKKGKHQNANCVDCHYPPKAAGKSKQPQDTGSETKLKHISQNPPAHFSYIPLGGETIKKQPQIIDDSCMTSNCHGKPEDTFKTKIIKFTDKVKYIHKPHLEKRNQIDGQKVNCTTCHQHITEKKHFEVSKESCFLCHFKNTKFAEGRSKCTLCHELPKKPIQTSGDKPITHKMLQDSNVQCGSCHYDLISGGGQIKYELVLQGNKIKNTQIMGGGLIKKESCSNCHDQAKYIKEATHRKLMHEQHVTVKNALCFDCHNVILHKKAYVEKPITIRKECMVCHPDHHQYQELLVKGLKRKNVSQAQDPMFKAMTNCLGCHNESGIGKKGERVLKASGKTCVSCHTKQHDKMLQGWIDELAREVNDAEEIEIEAKKALAEFEGKLSKEKVKKFRQMIREGQANLRIVQYGNGVHNKKYSMMLIDAALNNFEDLIDEIDELVEGS